MENKMNKRFKELAQEARLLTGWPVGEVEYQKFAELIVRECANVAAEHEALDIYEEIREHFGVAE
jgi:hypothetical protein